MTVPWLGARRKRRGRRETFAADGRGETRRMQELAVKRKSRQRVHCRKTDGRGAKANSEKSRDFEPPPNLERASLAATAMIVSAAELEVGHTSWVRRMDRSRS
jgi:hypothetical protein